MRLKTKWEESKILRGDEDLEVINSNQNIQTSRKLTHRHSQEKGKRKSGGPFIHID